LGPRAPCTSSNQVTLMGTPSPVTALFPPAPSHLETTRSASERGQAAPLVQATLQYLIWHLIPTGELRGAIAGVRRTLPSCIAFLADPRPHRAWPPLKRGAASARPRFDCQEAGDGYPEYSFRLIANQDAGQAHSPGRTTYVFAYSGIRQTAVLSSTPQSWWRCECPDPPRCPPARCPPPCT
jgi:hypothetical protein